MYRRLNAQKIIETSVQLESRIRERFATSGLARVAAEVVDTTRHAMKRSADLARPYWFLRLVLALLVLLILGLLGMSVWGMNLRPDVESLPELIQVLEAGVNDLIFLAVAIFFLMSFERRLKRERALVAMDELRALAHVIDMHQLTKDPERLLIVGPDTSSSPSRRLNPFQLSRYLDYCSEMLSIISKVAAIYVQELRDPVVLDAVDAVESLSNGLSRKIWQKLMILHTTTPVSPF